MQIIVSGKQVDVGESLREHIEARLEDGISKYLDRVTSVKVVISKESHRFRADINGNTGTHSGITIKSHAENDDVYAAFDSAADKVIKQLRRYKRRITNHHKTTDTHAERDYDAIAATKYIIEDSNVDDDIEVSDAPAVIAEKDADIETLSVSDAVMKMDLADLPALLFVNSANGQINVVYRRKDGNISWVDPSKASIKAA